MIPQHQRIPTAEVMRFVSAFESGAVFEYAGQQLISPYIQAIMSANDISDIESVFTKLFTGDLNNAPTSADNLERHTQDSTTTDRLGEIAVRDDGRSGDNRTGITGGKTEQIGLFQQGDTRLPDNTSPVAGTGSDNRIYTENGEAGLETGVAGSPDSGRGGNADDERIQPERGTDAAIEADDKQIIETVTTLKEKIGWQAKANLKPVVFNDKNNITETLPLLLSHQVDDVVKAEKRFFGDDSGKGIMFTNATGTGKTFTGLGIINRFYRAGKQNILIVVPSQQKVSDWSEDGEKLGLDVTPLSGIKDAGQGVCVTTYANFGQNEAILNRKWDLIVYDESHKLSANESGKENLANKKHKLLSAVPSKAIERAKHFDPGSQDMNKRRQAYTDSLIPSILERMEKKNEQGFNYSRDETDPEKIKAGRLLAAQREAKSYADSRFYEEKREIEKRLADTAKSFEQNTKTVFLSATPFSYHDSLDYADGCLFNISEGKKETETNAGYNAGNTSDHFYMQNFGYRMRYNKLTEPESGVDISLMERQFNEKLKKQGVLSSKRLEVDTDYSREFVILDAEIGHQIEDGISIIRGYRDSEKNNFYNLPKLYKQRFSSVYVSQLLEAIKAKYSIDRIKKHLSLNRKVIVFHSYMNIVPYNPFDFSDWINAPDYAEEIRRFYKNYPQYRNIDLKGIGSVPETIKKAFGGRAVTFNGSVKQSERSQAVRKFNEDDSGIDVLVIQIAAGKEGISLHDTTGKKQRVVYTVGLPTAPTDAIQAEGRAYRTGQKSNAIFEYPVLHTDFEKFAFREKIATRTKTAENLAMGDAARNLEGAFKDGYLNANDRDPDENQGIGGKEGDKYIDGGSDPFDIAKTHYWARQKKTSKTKSYEGKDYYATPEPLGLKMVQWAGLKPNESVLEPSAGHGAIARYFPENTKNVMIEQSGQLTADLGLIAGQGKIIQGSFEDFNSVNKFDAIVMNPPFGKSGKVAAEHVIKAMGHLKNGGRLIAIVPESPGMSKRIEKVRKDKDYQDFYEIAEISLPAVTFERAGTSVKTKILIFDRYNNPADAPDYPRKIELQSANIDEFFSKIKEIGIPERKTPTPFDLPDDVDVEEIFEYAAGDDRRIKTSIYQAHTFSEIETLFNMVFHQGSKQEEKKPGGIKFAAGRKAVTWLPDDTPIEFQYAMMEIDDVITSHTDEMYINKEFPQEVQPRERDRAGMQMQIAAMANRINPERLADSPSATSGAPIMSKKRVIESGNGRTMAIRRAYKEKKADGYKKWMVENSDKFGIPTDTAKLFDMPVLLRLRLSDIDAADFARKANQGETAAMSPAEVARADAERITDNDMDVFKPSDEGYIGAKTNQAFINNFFAKLGVNETAGLLTANGDYTRQALERIQAAIFYKAYRDDNLLALMIEESNPAIRNIISALTVAAPDFAKAKSVDPDLDGINIPSHAVAAARLLKKAKEDDVDVDMIIRQLSMFDDPIPPETVKFAKFLNENTRSAKRMGFVFRFTAEKLKEHLLNKDQTDMFGEKPKVTPSEIIDRAIQKSEEMTNAGKNANKGGIFESSDEGCCAEGEYRIFGTRTA